MHSKIITENILLHETQKLRNAIIISNKLPDSPNNCCGICSNFLAKYLVEEIGLNPNNIFFIHTDCGAHAWILINGINYNIIANQYREFSDEIVVWKKWIWGEKFCKKSINRISYNNLDIERRIDTYKLILSSI